MSKKPKAKDNKAERVEMRRPAIQKTFKAATEEELVLELDGCWQNILQSQNNIIQLQNRRQIILNEIAERRKETNEREE